MSRVSIEIYGDHDDRTIQQLERCLEPVDGARGVLMPDGHLGYSAPIGGVMAYPEHVSPSGVGFDIGWGRIDWPSVRATMGKVYNEKGEVIGYVVPWSRGSWVSGGRVTEAR